MNLNLVFQRSHSCKANCFSMHCTHSQVSLSFLKTSLKKKDRPVYMVPKRLNKVTHTSLFRINHCSKTKYKFCLGKKEKEIWNLDRYQNLFQGLNFRIRASSPYPAEYTIHPITAHTKQVYHSRAMYLFCPNSTRKRHRRCPDFTLHVQTSELQIWKEYFFLWFFLMFGQTLPFVLKC